MNKICEPKVKLSSNSWKFCVCVRDRNHLGLGERSFRSVEQTKCFYIWLLFWEETVVGMGFCNLDGSDLNLCPVN